MKKRQVRRRHPYLMEWKSNDPKQENRTLFVEAASPIEAIRRFAHRVVPYNILWSKVDITRLEHLDPVKSGWNRPTRTYNVNFKRKFEGAREAPKAIGT